MINKINLGGNSPRGKQYLENKKKLIRTKPVEICVDLVFLFLSKSSDY